MSTRDAQTCLGLAHYRAGRWPDALAAFQAAARASEVPEDWFNLAMAKVKTGDLEGAHAAWRRSLELGDAHPDAPETSSVAAKTLLFAEALRDASACDGRGLDLLEDRLLPFYTIHHVTDASFWGLRRIPPFEAVLDLLLDYYRALGRPRAAWEALLDGVAADVDDDGRAYCAALRRRWEDAS